MKIEDIKTEKELKKFFEKKYGGIKAINRKIKKNYYTKADGSQYYSSAQSRAILNASQ